MLKLKEAKPAILRFTHMNFQLNFPSTKSSNLQNDSMAKLSHMINMGQLKIRHQHIWPRRSGII